jgi:uncharacterized membrane protein YeaQ/YmgE (transglycosylase-associated protein family)
VCHRGESWLRRGATKGSHSGGMGVSSGESWLRQRSCQGVPIPVTVAGRRGCFPTPAAGAVGGVSGGLLMERVCGMLGSRVCGLLGSMCGSVGLAVLVVALAALATRHAYAEDPVPVPIPINCSTDCACFTPPPQPCYYGMCQGVVGCDIYCGCTGPDTGVDCHCVG